MATMIIAGFFMMQQPSFAQGACQLTIAHWIEADWEIYYLDSSGDRHRIERGDPRDPITPGHIEFELPGNSAEVRIDFYDSQIDDIVFLYSRSYVTEGGVSRAVCTIFDVQNNFRVEVMDRRVVIAPNQPSRGDINISYWQPPPRRPGECMPELDRPEPTCQAEMNIHRAIGQMMGEMLDDEKAHQERCREVWGIYYISDPQPDADPRMGHVVVCDGQRGNPNLFFGQTVRAYFTLRDMSGYNFEGSTLSGSWLENGNLQNANFTNANLSGVNFSGADLSRANLTGANLSGANLSGANLTSANFTGANLQDTNFSDANMNQAIIAGADLTRARLSRVQNIATIFMSETTIFCETVGYNDEVVSYSCPQVPTDTAKQ